MMMMLRFSAMMYNLNAFSVSRYSACMKPWQHTEACTILGQLFPSLFCCLETLSSHQDHQGQEFRKKSSKAAQYDTRNSFLMLVWKPEEVVIADGLKLASLWFNLKNALCFSLLLILMFFWICWFADFSVLSDIYETMIVVNVS